MNYFCIILTFNILHDSIAAV